MYVLMLVLHILVSFTLMAVVLMQSGKGKGLAGTFGGGGGNQTVFGGRGAVDFLGKATWILGAAFMVTSLSLAVLSASKPSARGPESLIKKEAATAPATLPSGGPGTLPEGTGTAPGTPSEAPATPAPGTLPAGGK